VNKAVAVQPQTSNQLMGTDAHTDTTTDTVVELRSGIGFAESNLNSTQPS
jgi:hypothetical protein